MLRQLPAGVVPDAVVGGVGTGGTIVGVGQAVRAVNPRCHAPVSVDSVQAIAEMRRLAKREQRGLLSAISCVRYPKGCTSGIAARAS